ncbi:hypothetical protein [uncultured Ilyobacter sp.]|uniref:hypothetical protein n=1 Tax=uncultured Ilyobacter sp. TaxID=544433 RepID=UPI0029C6E1A1|nr:hypothetical protein [uncultured Ilyobacter sp.]
MQLKLDFNICKNPDWIYKEVMAYFEGSEKEKKSGVLCGSTEIDSKRWTGGSAGHTIFFQKDKKI